jgi:RNA polymerase sigma-70 factor, ECF subfamily
VVPTHPIAAGFASEPAVVEAARAGNEQAIRAIIRAHNRMLFRLARSILSSDDEAEDAVQAANVRAFAALSSFRGEARIGTWLGRIVINEALGRAQRQRPSVPKPSPAWQWQRSSPSLEARLP